MNSFKEKHPKALGIKKRRKFYKKVKLFPLIILSIVLLFSSCVTQRNVEYLRDKSNQQGDIKIFSEAKVPDYKLKPKDELYIQIKSLDDPSTNVFQQVGVQTGNQSGYLQPYSASLMSYPVDKAGYIQLPILGNILVENKSVPEVSAMLQDSLENILSQPTVTVKLVNRFVSVLGEVRNPGHFSYSQEKLTVFDALGLAGDITEYGDRNDVILARNENGNNIRINIDLTSSELMALEHYYIRPNDVIYVKPMRKKFWGMRQFPFQILLSTLSTGILFYTVFGQ
ncbi:polysaccharide biosynthesis/export family protein [Mariniphaga sp.]|uniref:polysaccharide biosynthesis/export family protein n=1 Tax=Mariniphaga sp. TaxID=1954475 RepID=UPI00356467C3